ncbi:MAG TPA: cyclic nucleotide-binding domain-containing protein [Actinomycetota bacterium]|nr:cyclic nucleotide-binding domain-containing protein [Actinomycetota bacterium]
MRNIDPYTARLRSVPLLSGSPSELRELTSLGTEVDVAQGYVLMREDDPGREGFIVLSGRASVEVDGVEVATLGPGQIVGEMALLDRLPRSATVRAQTPMRLLTLSALEFSTLLDRCPTIRRGVMRMVAERLRRVQGPVAVRSA